MFALRRLIFCHSHLAAALVALALLLKIAVPAGFMPAVEGDRIVVAICNATGASTMVLQLPGREHEGQKSAQSSCAFADLSLPSWPAVDPIQLAELLAFILATAVVTPIALSPIAFAHLRPPLRGPPARP